MSAVKAPKPLNPRSPDTKYNGTEPLWNKQPDADCRQSTLVRAFGWYNYYCSRSDAKTFVQDWLERNDRSRDAKSWRSVPEQVVPYAIGWLARMQTMGLMLNEHEELKLQTTVKDLLQEHKPAKEIAKETTEETVAKPNIQDRLKEKVSEAAAEIDGLFDEMIASGNKMTADHKPINILRGMNVAPQLIGPIRQLWVKQRDEFAEAAAQGDADLWEAYSHFGKLGLRNMIKFADQVIADCESYIQIKKVERKPRAKKAVSPEKLTQRFKYMKEFAELKLTSEPVTKLVGATEAWFYDTKKRKLIHVTADSHVGCFTVKGSALIGLDATNSVQKTLRKPAEQIKALMSGGIPAARKYFKDIKATETKFNGRGNENLVLLRVK